MSQLEYRAPGAFSADTPEATTPSDQSARKYFLVTMALLAVVYALLYSPRWIPEPDEAYYLSTARNLANGKGYEFCGSAAVLVPPGWPAFLAGVLKLTSSFTVLSLLPPVFMLASAGLWFFVLLRFVNPLRSAVIVVISGTLFYWYFNAFILMSEGMFCLAFTWALLLAMQMSEGKSWSWRLVALLLCCAVMVSVRWAGILSGGIIWAALLGRQFFPRNLRQWMPIVLTGVVIIGLFYGWRVFNVYTAKESFAQNVKLSKHERPDTPESAILKPKSPWGWVDRFLLSGVWFCSLFFQPATVAGAYPLVGYLADGLGWLIFLFFLIPAVMSLRRGNWLLMSVAVYCMIFCLIWSQPTPRYLLPVAPLLLLGLWKGVETVGDYLNNQILMRGLLSLLLWTVFLCNLAMLSVDVFISHSGDFYGYYYDGKTRPLIDYAAWLKTRNLKDGELAVSYDYTNMSRTVFNGFGMRSMYFLTDRIIRSTDKSDHFAEPSKELAEWAEKQTPKVKYYLYRPPVEPWVVWHFRMDWLEKLATHKDTIDENPLWKLYVLDRTDPNKPAVWHEVIIPPGGSDVSRVPGL